MVATQDPATRNQRAIEEFRANAGQLGGDFAGVPVLLLHTTDPTSGDVRVHPLTYRRRGQTWVVVASHSGAQADPSWVANLLANPEVSIEVGLDSIPVLACLCRGAERDAVWAEQKALVPRFADYEAMTPREIPVIILQPR